MNDNLQPSTATSEWADLQIARTSEVIGSLLDQHAALYRWVLAARLTVNGGAAVAVMNSTTISASSAVWAIFAFFVGILAAIFSAELGQKNIQAGLPPNIKMLGFWVKFKTTGVYDQESMNSIIQGAVNISKQKSGRIVGWFSLIMFAVGAFVAGTDILLTNISNSSCHVQ